MRRADAEERVGRKDRRVGEFIQALTEGRGASGVPDGVVTRVSIRLPTADAPEVLIVVKATGADGDMVAFVGGLDASQALLVWAAKDAGPGLRWRADVPWSQR